MGDFLDKIKQMWNTPDDEYDYDDRYDDDVKKKEEPDIYPDEPDVYPDEPDVYPDEPAPIPPPSPANYGYTPPIYSEPAPAPVNSNRIMNIDATTKLQVVVFRPDRFSDETRMIADELLKQHTIVLNLENTGKDNSRRIIDFMSGAAYASGGRIKRVAASTFLVIPGSVHMTGEDLVAQLENNGVIV